MPESTFQWDELAVPSQSQEESLWGEMSSAAGEMPSAPGEMPPGEGGDLPAFPGEEPVESELTDFVFTTVCPLCGTRQDTDSTSIGRKLKCPDCHSSFVVRQPHRSARRARSVETVTEDGELQLRAPPPAVERTSMAGEYLAEASKPSTQAAKGATRTSPNEMILETLRQAEREVAAAEALEAPRGEKPFGLSVFRLFQDPVICVRWLMMSAVLYIELGAIEEAIELGMSTGMQQILGLLMGLFAFVLGALLFSFMGASLLLVTQHTAQGRHSVEGWPGPNFLEWMFDAWTLFASLFLTLAPLFAIARIAAALGADAFAGWFLFIALPLAATFVFPVLQLSMMENSMPYSRPVWNSLVVSAKHWRVFWFWSSGILLAIAVCVVARLRSQSGIVNFLVALLIMLGLLFYFRLLGRLTWVCELEMGEREMATEKPENSG